MTKIKEADFTIIKEAVHINLECPHCRESIRQYPFTGDDHYEYHEYRDFSITCPECQEEIKLGDADYD